MLPFSEACERNKQPILSELREAFAHSTTVLEIGSGTGQHAVYFAANLPHLQWYPTEQRANLEVLAARVRAQASPNLQAAAQLEVCQPVWPHSKVDAVFTANTLHIMSWESVRCLFEGTGRVLASQGHLCIYGPFRYQGRHTSLSNAEFDRMLKQRDPLSGLRDLEEIRPLAARSGLRLLADHDLPANNRLLVFGRES